MSKTNYSRDKFTSLSSYNVLSGRGCERVFCECLGVTIILPSTPRIIIMPYCVRFQHRGGPTYEMHPLSKSSETGLGEQSASNVLSVAVNVQVDHL